jgi:hypothetical protein
LDAFLGVVKLQAADVGLCVRAMGHFRLGAFVEMDQSFGGSQRFGGHLKHFLSDL